MPRSGAGCVVVLAACVVCDTAVGDVFGGHAGGLVSCRRVARDAPPPHPSGWAGERRADSSRISKYGADRFTRGPDQAGRRSDTLHFLSYQGVSVAILYALPESVTGWTDEQKETYSLSKWWENVQNPEWDTDDFFLNYVTHPYWGAAYFVRSRERGYDDYDSFWYSAALSASYEFGAEALFENPSIQDLIVTPVGGWLVGRYFMTVREDILASSDGASELPLQQRLILTLTDPLGAINSTVDRWFGLDRRLTIQPFYVTREVRPRGPNGEMESADSERVYGLTFTYVW